MMATIMDRINAERRQEEIEAARAPIAADVAAQPCGCPACDNGVQPGHFACEQPPTWLIQCEAEGLVTRHYDDGAWRWMVA